MIEIARKDAWTDKEDVLLAEIVLEHMKEGKTQLKAFEAASGELNRTERACGFRWNKVLRKQYEQPISEARRQTSPPFSMEEELKKKVEVWERAWKALEQFVRYVRESTK